MPLRTAHPLAPTVNCDALWKCQMQEWYPMFKSVTLKTRFIELEPSFVEYLLSDGIILPRECDAPHDDNDKFSDQSWSSSFSNDGELDQGADDEAANAQRPSFESLIAWIERTIEEMGGEVFPKLNWSAPRDTTWINAGENLKCMSSSDVILLIKCSDFSVHDICHAFDCCEDTQESLGKPFKPMLVLRKWFDMPTCNEFRCFVHRGRLMGISQRDCANFFEFLLEQKSLILDVVVSFFHREIQGKFPLDSFVFDVYIRHRDNKAFLIDFNPFGGLTQPLLFQWPELAPNPGEDSDPVADVPELRLVASSTAIRPPLAMYSRMPTELQNATDPRAFDDMVRQARSCREEAD